MQVVQDLNVEIWTRTLSNDEFAVAVVHRSFSAPFVRHKVLISLNSVGWTDNCAEVEDLHGNSNRWKIQKHLDVIVNYQDAAMYRLYRSPCTVVYA